VRLGHDNLFANLTWRQNRLRPIEENCINNIHS